jgi:putative hydrolase of the HAD superfamily
MATNPTHIATVFLDADNTLWETDKVFADAQLRLLGAVEALLGQQAEAEDRLAYVRQIDQGLAERHHSGLRYPPELLGYALALTLRGERDAVAIRRALKETHHGAALDRTAVSAVADAYVSALKVLPSPRPGVAAGLQALHRLGCMVLVVTEGARARIARTVEALHLETSIDRIVEAPKHTRLYLRIARLSRAPGPMFMVGDQLQRDIAPAKAAGLETIYFPGAFVPRWEPSEDSVRPDHRIGNFEEVATIVAAKVWARGTPDIP